MSESANFYGRDREREPDTTNPAHSIATDGTHIPIDDIPLFEKIAKSFDDTEGLGFITINFADLNVSTGNDGRSIYQMPDGTAVPNDHARIQIRGRWLGIEGASLRDFWAEVSKIRE